MITCKLQGRIGTQGFPVHITGKKLTVYCYTYSVYVPSPVLYTSIGKYISSYKYNYDVLRVVKDC